ncbi:MAG: prephenate dehydrogenase [Candidatus Omnitrophica bacterium]|nr:prephenate dehydrogenase [Candidatus Omnitrophota bacterium]MDD5770703.1 prephenate dehydrogenase [Candidatus Omnitrophota bacterium]
MELFNKAVIIGTGLIGGSLGLDLKKRRLVREVVGLSRNRKNAGFAKKAGAIDSVGSSLEEVRDADLVVLAMPPEAIIATACKISGKIKKGCVVIDVGSSKEKIVSEAGRSIPFFVGCHPLSGSEKRGVGNLSSGIFNNSICIITPTAKTDKKVLRKVTLLWNKLGSKVVILSPERHDRILAFTSHLPHAVAFSLVRSIPDAFLGLCSGGFKDTTRISASDGNLWSEVFLSNRDKLLLCISAFQNNLSSLKLALQKKDKKTLVKILSSAKRKRDKIR